MQARCVAFLRHLGADAYTCVAATDGGGRERRGKLSPEVRRDRPISSGWDGAGQSRNERCNSRLTSGRKLGTLNLPLAALIVYRLGQEILNLQSGVRFPVGAPISDPPILLGRRVLCFDEARCEQMSRARRVLRARREKPQDDPVSGRLADEGKAGKVGR